MANCKLPVDICLEERHRSMSYLPGDPRNWHPSPCINCRTGRERQMEKHVPEPDEHDPSKVKQPFKITPMPCVVCATIVQKPSYRTRPICKSCYFEEKRAKAKEQREKYRCEQCGDYRSQYAKLCNKCYLAERRMPVTECVIKGCSNKPRRKGGLCDSHYYQQNRPQELERKRKANAEAARKYRIAEGLWNGHLLEL